MQFKTCYYFSALIPGKVPFAKKSSVAPPPVETKENFFCIFILEIKDTVSPPPTTLSAFEFAISFKTFIVAFVFPSSYFPSGPLKRMSFDFLINISRFFTDSLPTSTIASLLTTKSVGKINFGLFKIFETSYFFSSTKDFPILYPLAFRKLLASAPPTKTQSASLRYFLSKGILVENLAPPKINRKGCFGLLKARERFFISSKNSNPAKWGKYFGSETTEACSRCETEKASFT